MRLLEHKRLQQQAKIEKDKAFNLWYHPPWECEGRRANDNMVECVNSRKKAKKEFEKLWVEGKIFSVE
ncbi:hypothetical protein ACH42_00775 [Endozoicomonas sp. (ex Bugula neritina AB1)]|nr:hypothetical protein ACH42_00775 [Endozoicomonas sp. (ex Bugula neritina AB1)]